MSEKILFEDLENDLVPAKQNRLVLDEKFRMHKRQRLQQIIEAVYRGLSIRNRTANLENYLTIHISALFVTESFFGFRYKFDPEIESIISLLKQDGYTVKIENSSSLYEENIGFMKKMIISW